MRKSLDIKDRLLSHVSVDKMDAGIGLEVRISKDMGAFALGQEKRAEEKP